MESEAKYVWVGSAVLLAAALAVGALVWLVQPASGRFRDYTIYFERLPMDGLAVGSDVEMRGVKVGRVEDFNIEPTNINRVRVVINVDRRTPVSVNTVAGVDRNYVTRVARITLSTPGVPGPLLTAVPPGEANPVIPEGRSELADVTRTLKTLGDQSAEALDALSEVLGPDNRAAVRTTLANVAAASATLGARLERIDRTLAAAETAITRIGEAGTTLARTTDEVRAELVPTVVQARSTLAELERAADTLERSGGALVERLGAAADASSDQIASTAIELRRSAAAIARALEGFENPRSALIGPSERQLGPGEVLQ